MLFQSVSPLHGRSESGKPLLLEFVQYLLTTHGLKLGFFLVIDSLLQRLGTL